MSFEKIAAQLGAEGVGWAIERLRIFAPLVGDWRKSHDPDDDRCGYQAAKNLQTWVHVYANACDHFGEDEPECIAELDQALERVLPLIAQMAYIPSRRGGQTPDLRRQLCADACTTIWCEHHPGAGPYSERLWQACETYWQRCGQPPTSGAGNLKQWARYCAATTTQLAKTF